MQHGAGDRRRHCRAQRGGSLRWRGPTTGGPAWRSRMAGPASCQRPWQMPAQACHLGLGFMVLYELPMFSRASFVVLMAH
jgi:hypothetical protein